MSAKGSVHYAPEGDGTRVTFGMTGGLEGFAGRLMGAVMTPMLETAFDANLQNISTKLAEEAVKED